MRIALWILLPLVLALANTVGVLAESDSIFSVASNDIQKAKAILDANPAAVNEKDKDGLTLLHHLAMATKIKLARDTDGSITAVVIPEEVPPPLAILLIDRGAAIDAGDKNGATPLHYAIVHGNSIMTKFLIQKGANVNAAISKGENSGMTPLHWAVSNGDAGTARLLVEKGAKLNPKNQYGQAPLHLAVIEKRISCVSYLLTAGADMNVKDGKGNTPLSLAREAKLTEIEKYLTAKGAK